jgi:hypothetical protein
MGDRVQAEAALGYSAHLSHSSRAPPDGVVPTPSILFPSLMIFVPGRAGARRAAAALGTGLIVLGRGLLDGQGLV